MTAKNRAQLPIDWTAPQAPIIQQPAPVSVEPSTPTPPPPANPPPLPAPSAQAPDPIEAFLGRCALRGYSRHTIRSYRVDLRKAQRHMGDLLTADEMRVDSFLAAETMRGCEPKTVCRRLNALRSFYRDARRYKLRLDDPTLCSDPPKTSKKLPRYLKDDQIAALFAALTDDSREAIREAAIVATFYHSGMRLSELVGLDVATVGGESIRVFGKGSKERELPVSTALRGYLDAWLAVHPGGTALFCSLGRHPGRLSSDRVRAIVKGVYRRIGFDEKGVGPHKLRHSFATRIINNGVRIDVIQKLLGHSDIKTTMMYAHTQFSSDLRAQLNAIL